MKVVKLMRTADKASFEEVLKRDGLRPAVMVSMDESNTPVLTTGEGITFKDVAYILFVLQAHFQQDFLRGSDG